MESKYNVKKTELAIEIISSIPDELDRPTMILKDELDEYNSQEYTKYNCDKLGVPFLPNFKDCDTYIKDDGSMRMQGYIAFKSIDDIYLTDDQLEFIIELLKSNVIWVKGRDSKYSNNEGFTLEVWNHTVRLK